MKVFDAIATRIHELMLQRGMNQYKLSKKIAISESCLYNIFHKRQRDIPMSRLFLICDGLGVTIQQFFDSPLFANLEIDY